MAALPGGISLLFVCPTYSLHKVSTVTALCTRPNWCSVLTDTLAATMFWGSCVQAASMGGVLACHGPHNVSAMHEDIGKPTYSQCLSQRATQLPDWVLLNPKKWLSRSSESSLFEASPHGYKQCLMDSLRNQQTNLTEQDIPQEQ